MMQMRDWVIGIIGVIIGALGILSLIGLLPFELSKSALVWVSAIAGLILLYAAIIEITNSNVMGTVSIILAGIALVVSLLPALNSLGILGSWAEFSWIGETVYRIILAIEGVFLAISTFAMEL